MTQFVITSPEGKKYRVTVPDGTPQAEVDDFVKKQIAGFKADSVRDSYKLRGLSTKKEGTTLERAQTIQDLNIAAGRQDIPTINQNPLKGYGDGGKFLLGAGKGLTDMVRGPAQMLGILSQQDVDAAAKRDKPIMESGAGQAGNITGQVAGTLPVLAIPGANTMAGSTLLGMALGGGGPVTSDESRGSKALTGALMGGGTSMATRVLPQAMKALIDPFTAGGKQTIAGRTIQRFGGNAPVKQAETPGWENTLAEATGQPGHAILQRGAQSASPDIAAALSERMSAQNAAALGAVRKIGGTPQQKSMAEALRGYMSKGFYDAAEQEGINPQVAQSVIPQIQNLMARPSMKLAQQRAREIMDEKSISLDSGGDVKGLQLLKQALDDIIEKAPLESSIGKNKLSSLEQTRSDLIAVMHDVAPKLRLADQNYKTFSRPINEMAVGDELGMKLTPALTDGMNIPNRLKPAEFAAALRSLDDKIPKITGYPGSTVENTLSGPNLSALEGVRNDLARRGAAQDAARGPGSNTAQNLSTQNILAQTLGPLGLPRSWSESIASSTVGRTAASPLGLVYNRAAEQEVQQELAKALLDPSYAQQVIRKANTPLLSGTGARAANYGLGLVPPAVVSAGNSQ